MKNFVFFAAIFFVFVFAVLGFAFFGGCKVRVEGSDGEAIGFQVSGIDESTGVNNAAAESSEKPSAVAEAEAELAKAEWRLASATSDGEQKVWQDRWQRARVQLDTARAEAASAAKPATSSSPGQSATTVAARDARGSWPYFDWHQKSIFWCLILVGSWLLGVLLLRDANEIWGAAFPLVVGLAGAAFLATSPDGGSYPVRLMFAGVSASLAALALYRPGPELLGLRIAGGLAALFIFYTLI